MSKQLAPGQFFGAVGGRWRTASNVLTFLRHPVARRVPPHSHQRPYVCLLLSGHYREQTRLRRIEYKPLTLVSHPAAFDHVDEIGQEGASFFTVEFLSDAAWPHEPNFGVHGGEAVWSALRLCREAAAGGSGQLGLEAGAAELRDALDARPLSKETTAPVWLRHIDERIDAEYLEPPTLESLSLGASVHPGHLARTYRRFHAESIGSAVRRRRILEAVRRLGQDHGLSLAKLAQDLSFADQSHFTRCFKEVTGMTPGECRRMFLDGGIASLPFAHPPTHL